MSKGRRKDSESSCSLSLSSDSSEEATHPDNFHRGHGRHYHHHQPQHRCSTLANRQPMEAERAAEEAAAPAPTAEGAEAA